MDLFLFINIVGAISTPILGRIFIGKSLQTEFGFIVLDYLIMMCLWPIYLIALTILVHCGTTREELLKIRNDNFDKDE